MFVLVDNGREMKVKKSCKYGEYVSFEHLLFFAENNSTEGSTEFVFFMLINRHLKFVTETDSSLAIRWPSGYGVHL